MRKACFSHLIWSNFSKKFQLWTGLELLCWQISVIYSNYSKCCSDELFSLRKCFICKEIYYCFTHSKIATIIEADYAQEAISSDLCNHCFVIRMKIKKSPYAFKYNEITKRVHQEHCTSVRVLMLCSTLQNAFVSGVIRHATRLKNRPSRSSIDNNLSLHLLDPTAWIHYEVIYAFEYQCRASIYCSRTATWNLVSRPELAYFIGIKISEKLSCILVPLSPTSYKEYVFLNFTNWKKMCPFPCIRWRTDFLSWIKVKKERPSSVRCVRISLLTFLFKIGAS